MLICFVLSFSSTSSASVSLTTHFSAENGGFDSGPTGHARRRDHSLKFPTVVDDLDAIKGCKDSIIACDTALAMP